MDAIAHGNPLDASELTPEQVEDLLQRGLDCCRRGLWEDGLRHLGRITTAQGRGDLPGLFYSYLGYGIAHREQRVREGLQLCRHAVKIQFYEAENYLNLARTSLLARDRKGAIRATRDGLRMDPRNTHLRNLLKEMGTRKSPVLPFLDRSNPINVFLGKLRHVLRG
jgi:hypothetical protein